MLSRHFLRSKVLQELYACEIEERDAIMAMREFEYHVGRLNELGILQVALMVRMFEVGEKVIEEGRRKFRPTAAEKSPNRKFLQNEFLRRMADNYDLKRYMEQWGGCWDTHEDLVREAFIDFRKQDAYCQYLSHPETDFEQDKELAIMMFRYLMNREALVAVIAERSLLWEDDFEQIAQYNFMMLKTLEEQSFDEAMLWPVMYDRRQEKDEADMDFARQLLRQTIAGRRETDELIKARLHGWEFERVALMDILLINMAVAEFTACPSIPEKVTVDEYIELSKEFSSERSRLFINGILDKLMLQLRSQGRIQKSGRGLVTALLLALSLTLGVSCQSKGGETDVDLIRNPRSAQGYDTSAKMPVLAFDSDLHDFGRLSAGESVSYSFHFRNTGNADLIISNCSATCGCTVADFPKGRIAPGEDGYVTVTFKSAGKSGQQFQEVTVVSNAQPARTKLKIIAQVNR